MKRDRKEGLERGQTKGDSEGHIKSIKREREEKERVGGKDKWTALEKSRERER
jgi:hypothetical protein